MQQVTSLTGRQSKSWVSFGWVAIGFALCLFALLYQTVSSMISIWWRSDTFAHGFLILPIAVWLIWNRRVYLQEIRPHPSFWVLILVFGAGFIWFLGYLVDALVIQQLSLIAILVAGIWTILGNRVTWALAFPLGFLFFAVPAGEGLVPHLMEFTATFTVGLLKLTGIPVYREGLFFSLPSGNWSVIEECSGVRYLMASTTLGCLYAYLTYRSIYRRLIFIAAALIVPIIANGMRAYIIVMLGHLSDMKLATGVDHLIYGWVFFGIVMLMLFAVGSIWRETEEPMSQHIDTNMPEAGQDTVDWIKPAKAGAITTLIIAIWPLLAFAINQHDKVVLASELDPPPGNKNWELIEEKEWSWKPIVLGATSDNHFFYGNNQDIVSIYIGLFLSQTQDAELINAQNILVKPGDKHWRISDSKKITIKIGEDDIEIVQGVITGNGNRLLVWHWYRVGEHYTSNRYYAKLIEAIERIKFGRQDAAFLTFATPLEDDLQEASGKLQRFLAVILPQIEVSIDRIVGEE